MSRLQGPNLTASRSAQSGLRNDDLSAVTRSVASRLRELSLVGADPHGGWSRIAFTPVEREAHSLFARWSSDLGLEYRTDSIGNSYARRGSGERPLRVGSHLDTVPRGGNFDGAAGVVAAIEAVAMLAATPMRHPVEVVAFSAEEGARFGTPCLGSRLITGAMGLEELRRASDADGVTAFDAAELVGLRPSSAMDEIWSSNELACYLELHIEQGRVLEDRNRRIGIVEAIAGATRFAVTLRGRTDHSGTTPMRLRQDALAGAAEIVVYVEEAAKRGRTTVATVGRLQVEPNVITAVPGEVTFSVDIRDIDPVRQRQVAGEILDHIERVSARRRLASHVRLVHDQSPVVLHYWVRQELAVATAETNVDYKVMPSGAGHDAGYVSAIAPAGMVFVPSRRGISHAPEEWSDAEDIALGAVVLASALARIDQQEWLAQ
jgi:allantoate deiminase